MDVIETDSPVKFPFEVTVIPGSTVVAVLLVALVAPVEAVMDADVPDVAAA